MLRLGKYFLGAFIVVVVGLSVYAFASSTYVPPVVMGEGASTNLGYTASGITYNLSPSGNPSVVASVVFNLNAAAVKAKIQLVSGGSWINCTNGSGNTWSCYTSNMNAALINQFRFAAASK